MGKLKLQPLIRKLVGKAKSFYTYYEKFPGQQVLYHAYFKIRAWDGRQKGWPFRGNFFIADRFWSMKDHAWRQVWRDAVRKHRYTGYSLWMKEAMFHLNRGYYAPDVPSASGGYADPPINEGDELAACEYPPEEPEEPEEPPGTPPTPCWCCTNDWDYTPYWICVDGYMYCAPPFGRLVFNCCLVQVSPGQPCVYLGYDENIQYNIAIFLCSNWGPGGLGLFAHIEHRVIPVILAQFKYEYSFEEICCDEWDLPLTYLQPFCSNAEMKINAVYYYKEDVLNPGWPYDDC